MKNKWAIMLVSIGGLLICTSPLLNKQIINILMGLTFIILGFILSQRGK
ncbi:hypothetical protein [Caviibacter abscessus]|nr:hypothetical protein [Caviibacter abscessus]